MAHFLVVEDDPGYAETVAALLDSMEHGYDTADDQKQARALIAQRRYDAVLLDLNLPVASGKAILLQAGQNLIPFILESSTNGDTPIIVMSGEGCDGPTLGVKVVKAGAVTFVPKWKQAVGADQFLDDLQEAIAEALEQNIEVAGRNAPKSVELVLRQDSVAFCGIPVRVDGVMRRMLDMLFKANGELLTAKRITEELHLDIDATAIAKAVQKFRDRITVAAAKHKILWDRDDLILNDRNLGYRFSPRVIVRDGAGSFQTNGASVASSAWNERQSWILDRLGAGQALRRPDIMAEFEVAEATVKRDLAGLSRAGFISFLGSPKTGHYVLVKSRS